MGYEETGRVSYAKSTADRVAEYSRNSYRLANDIAPIPKVANRRRRNRCKKSLRLFAETYFPERFTLKWSPDHLDFISHLEDRITEGGYKAQAMPRGSGKSSLVITAAEWAALYGFRQYLFLIAVSDSKAKVLIDVIKTDLFANEKLAADFPEACYPIKKLEQKSIKAKSQTLKGDPTYITWSTNRIILPQVPKSISSQAVFHAAGITSGEIRGAVYTTPKGAMTRPDWILLDDPQDDEVALSPAQCEKRERLIDGAVLGMAGPTTRVSAFMTCTVIADGDLSSIFLSRKLKPEWRGDVCQMMPAMPVNLDKWDEYKTVRDDELEAGGDGTDSTKFYLDNQDAMDEGAVVSWPERIEGGTVSAIQTAMHKYLYVPNAFASEYQNKPLARDDTSQQLLRPEEISQKIGSHKRGLIPSECHTLVCHIDIQKTVLYFTVLAVEDRFTSYVVDYGTWPQQRATYFTLSSLRSTLARKYPGAGMEGAIHAGLTDLIADLEEREWKKDNKETMGMTLGMIDANWGESTDIVRKVCRDIPQRGKWFPAFGRGVLATSRPLTATKKKSGERRGIGWRQLPVEGMPIRQVLYDTNLMKSFVHERLSAPRGAPGCMLLFKDKPNRHRMFAEQMRSEWAADVEALGQKKREWKQRPDRPDNHFFDNISGCVCAAMMAGCALDEHAEQDRPKRKRRKRLTL